MVKNKLNRAKDGVGKKLDIDMFKRYAGRLIFRVIVFCAVLYGYIFIPEYFDTMLLKRIDAPWDVKILWIYLVWAILMGSMVMHMLPQARAITMGSRKHFESNYREVKGHEKLEMYQYVQKNNLAAIKVLLVWLSFNAVFGILYIAGVIESKELILLSLFYYVSDLICVVVWCPFQSFIVRNKCCVNCRIFNWGHFMMFTPMLFICNFFTWSLFFTAIVVMLRWEITLLKHPERFWEGSNDILKCANCRDKICRIKGAKFTDETNAR